jgi:hypothetical protein
MTAVFRQLVTPQLSVVVDDSNCIVVDVHMPNRPEVVLSRVTVTSVDNLICALDAAWSAVQADELADHLERSGGIEPAVPTPPRPDRYVYVGTCRHCGGGVVVNEDQDRYLHESTRLKLCDRRYSVDGAVQSAADVIAPKPEAEVVDLVAALRDTVHAATFRRLEASKAHRLADPEGES